MFNIIFGILLLKYFCEYMDRLVLSLFLEAQGFTEASSKLIYHIYENLLRGFAYNLFVDFPNQICNLVFNHAFLLFISIRQHSTPKLLYLSNRMMVSCIVCGCRQHIVRRIGYIEYRKPVVKYGEQQAFRRCVYKLLITIPIQ